MADLMVDMVVNTTDLVWLRYMKYFMKQDEFGLFSHAID